MSTDKGIRGIAHSLCQPQARDEGIHGVSDVVMGHPSDADESTVFSRNKRPRESVDDMDNQDVEIIEDPDVVVPNIVFRNVDPDEVLTEERCINWLKKAENGKLNEFIMTKPPLRPKGGQVFLYRCQGLLDQDYRRDGYTGLWSNYNNNRSQAKLQRIAFHLKDNKRKVIPGFEKQVMSLRKYAAKPNKIKLIWYSGDESLWTPRAHGNSHDKQATFTSNTAACRGAIRQLAHTSEQSPMLVYRKSMQHAANEDPLFHERQEIVGPRNKKQVQNEMQAMRTQSRVHEDAILSVYLMGRTKMLGDFIREMKLLEREAIIVAETEALNLTRALLKEASDDGSELPLVLGFDTTFNLADAYVSPLVVRNAFLQGNPIFACAFLIHERRTHDVHKFFWDTMKTLLPLTTLPKTVPIVSDREAGLLKGMFDSLGVPGESFHHVPCSIHIKRDAKQWLLDNKAPSVDVSTYVREIDQLLNCETEELFEEMYNTMEETWSQPFVEYTCTRLKDDMKRSARFFTKQFPAFADQEATSNFIESMNSILKHAAQWKTLRLDSVVMNLFNVTMSSLAEFDRAYKGVGNYRPKTKYSRRRPGFKLPAYAYWTEEQFLQKFRVDYKSNEEPARETVTVGSAKALARIACEMNYVTLNSHSLTFTVTGPYDGAKAFVEEDDAGRLICSCEGTGLCFHKEAYLRVTKKVMEGDRTRYQLSKLRQKTRKTKGPSGRKKIAPLDINDVIPAPDSRVAQRRTDNEDEVSARNHEQQRIEDTGHGSTAGTSRSDKNDENDHDARGLSMHQNTDMDVEDNSSVDDSSSKESDSVEDDADIPTDAQAMLQSFPGSSRNTHEFQDTEEDEEEEMGFHFYSRNSFAGSTASKASTTGSWTVLHETPEIFKQPTADIQISSTMYKGIRRSLMGNEMLATDTVDNACALWIKIHDLEENLAFGSTHDFENAQANTFDSIRKLVSWAQRSEALNSDVVVVPMYIPQECQFALGAIIWRSKEILVIDSGPNASSYCDDLFEALMRMALASQIVAKCPHNELEWKFLLEGSMEEQANSVSSGVMCILNAFTVCSRQSTWTSVNTVAINVMRKWIAKCLSLAPNDNCVKLRDGQPIYRLTPIQRTKMASYLRCVTLPPVVAKKGSYLSKVLKEIGDKHFENGKCSSENCRGSDGDSEGIMCCMCRRWFHVGMCVERKEQLVIFYYCCICQALHEESARFLSDFD